MPTKFPFQGSTTFPTRAAPISVPPDALLVTQTSLSPEELLQVLREFAGTDTRFVAQFVWGSPVSLTISPTRAGND